MSAATPITRPPTGELVTDHVLTTFWPSTLILAQAFAGQTNPSVIWREMTFDAQRAYFYYRELEEKDDDIGSAIEEMKLSVTRREMGLVAGEDTAAGNEIRDFVQAQFDRIDLGAVIDSLLEAPFHGMAISEIIWDVSPGEVGIADIRDCPQEMFSFGDMMKPQVGPLRFMSKGPLMGGGDLVPEEKFLLFSYRPRARNRRGQPLLRKVFWPSWFKRQVQKFWLRAGEKGPGTAAVKYPSGATPEEKQQALALAEAMVSKIAIAVPENVGMVEQLLTQARPQNPAVYKDLFNGLQYAIARRIKGETLSSFANEGGTGSRSMGVTHSETKEERSKSFCVMVERVINFQLVKRLVLWNYGPNAPAPTFTIEKNPPQDLKMRAEIDNTLQGMGLPIPKSYAQDVYGVPEPGAADEVLVRSASATSPIQATGFQPGATWAEDPAVAREMKDVDRLLAQALKAGEGVMRDRIANLLAAVTR